METRLENFQRIKHYLSYGSKEAAKARLQYWSGVLNLFHITDQEAIFVKEQLDQAFEEYGR